MLLSESRRSASSYKSMHFHASVNRERTEQKIAKCMVLLVHGDGNSATRMHKCVLCK